ncbi:MAG TPA: hypothetical protein VHN80_22075, partial [Kineosporiaceae bacterium]|nr:hypothetical protein [Kineosporiaceae bacterium]
MAAIETTAPESAPRVERTALPAEFVGNQTTRSGIAVITTGSVTVPRDVETQSSASGVSPISAAVAAEILATA